MNVVYKIIVSIKKRWKGHKFEKSAKTDNLIDEKVEICSLQNLNYYKNRLSYFYFDKYKGSEQW